MLVLRKILDRALVKMLGDSSVKTCSRCGRKKPRGAFNARSSAKDKLQAHCRECEHRQFSEYYRKNKATHLKKVKQLRRLRRKAAQHFILSYLQTNGCKDCGEDDVVVLEFDHVRGQKKCAVSRMVAEGCSINSIKTGIVKCDVRCANCHRRATYRRSGSYRLQTE